MCAERPILILSASTGAGHTVVASALEAALTSAAAHETIIAQDILKLVGPSFRWMYGGGYLAIVRHFPVAMGWLYDTMDRPDCRAAERFRISIQNLFIRPVIRYLLHRRPKLIINTHFLSAEIVAQLRRQGRLDCPQVTVTTDFETHRMWVQAPTERYYTATDLGKAYLMTCGVPSGSIRAAGIPVRPAFEEPLDRDTIRRQLGLQPNRNVVLLLSSAGGVAPAEVLLRELTDMPADAQIVVIAGHYTKLRTRLEAQARGAVRPTIVIGYTDRMHEWMRAADLIVTKPGGSTVAEALVSGAPMVIVNPIPGQETRNSDYLLEHGAAIRVNNARLLGRRVSSLLGNPGRLRSLRTAAQELAQPGAATQIAHDALELITPSLGLSDAHPPHQATKCPPVLSPIGQFVEGDT